MPRKKVLQLAAKPLINFRKPVYESVSFSLSQGLIEQIKDYARYIQASTDERPTTDEVVEKGMQWLFDCDKGFQTWREKRAGEPKIARSEEAPQALSATAGDGTNPA